jgi:adenylylsulfate kinase-like enzyme
MTGERSGAGGGAEGGGVIWICGLSGAGKTTLSLEVARVMAAIHASVVRIDGDDFRHQCMPSAGYEREDRIRVARAIAQHAWALAQRGNLCVVATISLFSEIHDGNRASE